MREADESGDRDGRPRLDAFEMTARARDAYGTEGRPALPRTAHWPIFPFDTGKLQVRAVEDPVLPEPPRRDETADVCGTCAKPDADFVWTHERWLVGMSEEALSLPAVVLHPRAHLDFHELTDPLAAEMGVLLVRIQRALASVQGVGRVHVNKWGDGGAHLHVLVVARPEGMMQLRGMFLTTWMHVLPPLPSELWKAIRSHVATVLDASRANEGIL